MKNYMRLESRINFSTTIYKLMKPYTDTPFGGDYTTCPFSDHNYENDNIHIYFKNTDYEYCISCKKIFDTSHIYNCNGCTDSDYFVSTISKYSLNATVYNDSPRISIFFN